MSKVYNKRANRWEDVATGAPVAPPAPNSTFAKEAQPQSGLTLPGGATSTAGAALAAAPGVTFPSTAGTPPPAAGGAPSTTTGSAAPAPRASIASRFGSLPADVAAQTALAQPAASLPAARTGSWAAGFDNPVPLTGPTSTASYGPTMTSQATAAAAAANPVQHPPDVAHGGYGMLPAIPGQTQVATPGSTLTMFGAQGPVQVPTGSSATSLPGNRTIIGGGGAQTQVLSGAGDPNAVAERSRTVGADGATHIVTASGGRVDIPASGPAAPGGTGTPTGIVSNGQEIVRNGQGQLAPGTTPTAPTAPVSAAPSQMAAAGLPTLPAQSFAPVPTSSQPQPLQADPNAFSGQPLALNTGTGTPNTTGQRIADRFGPQPLTTPFAPSYASVVDPQTGEVKPGMKLGGALSAAA